MDEFAQTVAQLTGDPPRSAAQAQLVWALSHRLAYGPPLNEFDLTIVHHLMRLTGLTPQEPTS